MGLVLLGFLFSLVTQVSHAAVTIPTLDGTGRGQLCVLPFTYRGQVIPTCTNVNYQSYWCATTDNYDRDSKFGVCPLTYPGRAPIVNTENGKRCTFPFKYDIYLFYECTTVRSGTGKPWCSSTFEYRESSWGYCTGDGGQVPPTARPPPGGCTDTFVKSESTLYYGGTERRGLDTVTKCQAFCLSVPQSQCNSYEFNYGSNSCFTHSNTADLQPGNAFSPAAGVDHFRRTSCGGVTPGPATGILPFGCTNEFDGRVGQWARGGIPTQSRDTSSCRNDCLQSAQICYGYDFVSESAGTRCFIHTNPAIVDITELRGMATHFRRRCRIDATPTVPPLCQDNFVARARQYAFGGIRNDANSVSACTTACLQSPVLCYGFDFSTRGECFIHTNKNLVLRSGQDVTHYMRNFRCTTTPAPVITSSPGGCEDPFLAHRDQFATGGVRQPSVSGLGDCASACRNDQRTCYGFDWPKDNTRGCYLHYSAVDVQNLQPQFGVSYFMRIFEQRNCGSSSSSRQSDVSTASTTFSLPPGCRDRFTSTANSFAFGGRENSASSSEACATACLTSQSKCYGYDFNDQNKCFLHLTNDNLNSLQSGSGVTNYKREFHCNLTAVPTLQPTTGQTPSLGCRDTFQTFTERFAFGGTSRSDARSDSDCRNACLREATTCYGYDYSQISGCWVHLNLQAIDVSSLQNGKNVNHYRRQFICQSTNVPTGRLKTTLSTPALGCRDTFARRDNSFAYGGTANSASSSQACATACLNSPGRCYGYDFNDQNKCFLHFTNDNLNSLETGNGVTNYKRQFICDPTPIPTQQPTGGQTPSPGCRDVFSESRDRLAYGGTKNDAKNAQACRDACQKSSDTCYGVDWTNTGSCYLHLKRENLDNLAVGTGVTNYRRQFTCNPTQDPSPTPGCRDRFTERLNSFAYGGIANAAKSNDVCADQCLLYVIVCYGYDWSPVRGCFLHLTKNNLINPQSGTGVNQYTRQFICNPTVTPITPSSTIPSLGCRDFFSPTVDRFAYGGKLTTASTILACRDACQLSVDTCYGVDWTNTGSCYLHLKRENLDNLAVGTGVTNYRRSFGCNPTQAPTPTSGGCRDTFSENINRFVFGGMFNSARSSSDCSSACLSSSSTCYGYDYSSVTGCYLHLNKDSLNNLQTGTNVVNYKRQFVCQSTSMPIVSTNPPVGSTRPSVPGGCRDTFQLNADRFVYGGTLTNGAIRDQRDCEDFCLVETVGKCYAYDYSTEGNPGCFLHYSTSELKNLQVGRHVTHFRRQFICGGGGLTTPRQVSTPQGQGCRDPFFQTPDKFAFGGSKTDAGNSLECENKCVSSSSTCYGFDWDGTQRGCWLHLNKANLDSLQVGTGLTNYRREFRCSPTISPTDGGCKDMFESNPNMFAFGGTQTSATNSDDCANKCISSTSTCYGYDWNGQCWLHLKKENLDSLQSGTGVTNYKREFKCNPTSTPTGVLDWIGCYVDNGAARDLGCCRLDSGQMTVNVCAKRCRNHNKRYAAVQFGIQCFCDNDFGLYGIAPQSECNLQCSGRCKDTFASNANKFAFGGTQTSATNSDDCANKCISSTSTCYGYDWNGQCWLHLSKANLDSLQSGTGVTNYKREFKCNPTISPTGTPTGGGCKDTFASNTNKFAFGGTQTSATNSDDCANKCISSTSTCYGYDWNGQCWLHLKKENLDSLQSGTGVTNYKREFKCDLTSTPTGGGCRDTFASNANKFAFGGTQTSATNSDDCANKCISSTSTCYGYDWNGQCWLHLKKENLDSLQSGTGVTNYRREFKCNPTSTPTGGGCKDTFASNANKFAFGGIQTSATNSDDCANKCISSTSTCYGYDWNGQCWLHLKKENLDSLQSGTGVTNYKREFKCNPTSTPTGGGCRDTFASNANKFAFGGTQTSATNSDDCANKCISSTSTCYGYDWNGQCWLHLKKENLDSLQSGIGVTNYKREFKCNPTISPTGTPTGGGCRDTFASNTNKFAFGGTQTFATNSDDCANKCIASTSTCYGYDWNGQCWLHLNKANLDSLQSGTGVTNYKREFKCNPTISPTGTPTGGGCRDTFVSNANKFAFGGMQTSATNSDDCANKCISSTSTCYGYDWNGQCWLHLKKENLDSLQSGTGVTNYKREFKCNPTSTPTGGGCRDTFVSNANKFAFGGTQTSATNSDDCANKCISSTSTCYGYDWNGQCWLHLKKENLDSLQSGTGVTNYKREFKCNPTSTPTGGGCRDTFVSNANKFAFGGTQTSATNSDDCANKCISSTSTCYGYDWNGQCWLHLKKENLDSLQSGTGVTNYKREFKCNPTSTPTGGGCRDTFVSNANKFAFGGTQTSATNSDDCANKCISSTSTCYGYDWNGQCWLHLKKENLDSLQSGTGVTNYKREFKCNPTSTPTGGGCRDTFVSNANKFAFGGTQTSATNSDDCANKCISSTSTCYGYDWNGQCWLHLKKENLDSLQSGTGVTNYKREFKCNPTSTPTGGGCRDTFVSNANKFAFGGTQTSATNSDDCANKCISSTSTCYGYDWNGQCWLHLKKENLDSLQSGTGVTNYKREFKCNPTSTPTGGGCRDTFVSNANKFAFGGTQTSATNSDDCANKCISSTSTCYGYDWNGQCWLHLKKENLDSLQSGTGVTNYKREFKCNPTSTPTGETEVLDWIGCNVDNGEACDLGCCKLESKQMTVNVCAKHCRNQTKRYAAGQFHIECFCDNEFGLYGIAPRSECNLKCSGNASQTCGGHWRNEVYRVLGGCKDTFESNANKFAFGGTQTSATNSDDCANNCISSTSTCYGYDWNGQCWLHLKKENLDSLQSGTGVTNYKREFKCSPTSTPTGQPGCKDTFIASSDRFALGGTQTAATNTDDCANKCISSTSTCYGYDWNGQCWLHLNKDSLDNLQSGSGVTNYKREFKCSPTGSPTGPPGCKDTFITSSNRFALGGTQTAATNTDDCANKCISSTSTCYGYDWNGQCWLHLNKDSLDNLQSGSGVTNYKREFKCSSTGSPTGPPGCRDRFASNFDKFAFGGTETPATTSDDCGTKCLASPATCYGLDWTTAGKCFLHFNKDNLNNLQAGSGVTNYIREFTCSSPGGSTAQPGCRDRFASNFDQFALGGTETAATDSVDCGAKCLASTTTCYGLDWTTAGKCYLHFNKDNLNNLQAGLGVTNYIREFTCSSPGGSTAQTGCRDRFASNFDQFALGGTETAATDSVDCGAKCLASTTTCYGLDWTTAGKCYLHFNKDNLNNLQAGLGVTNYIREFTCSSPGGSTAQPGCRDTFVTNVNKYAFGGTQTSATTSADCENKCISSASTCYGYDWNGQCFLHLNKGNLDSLQTGAGVTNYIREFKCSATGSPTGQPGCKDTFVTNVDKFAIGGTQTPATNSDDCANKCIASTNTCYGYDWNGQCWLHLNQGNLNALQSGSGVTHYRREFKCNPSGSPTVQGPSTAVGCRDRFASNFDKYAFGGTETAAATIEECGTKCLASTATCYGFDWTTSGTRCFLHFRKSNLDNLQTGAGVTNYIREFSCSPTSVPGVSTAQPGCRDTFATNVNQFALGGKETAATSSDDCANKCIASTTICYGYDWNGKCWLHLNQGNLNALQAGIGVTNYKREFKCSSTGSPGGCKDAFTANADRFAYGANKAAATSNAACAEECRAQTSLTCYGYDWNGECWLHFNKANLDSLQTATGVTNYIRVFTCNPGQGGSTQTPVSGTCRMQPFTNANALGGTRQTAPASADECSRLCLATVACQAADWNKGNNQCFFHTQNSGQQTENCCNRYVKVC